MKAFVPRSAGYLHPDEVRDILARLMQTGSFRLTPNQEDEIVRYFMNGMPPLEQP